jgi:hypothetical protein
MIKTRIAVLRSLPALCFHTRNKEIPMRKYSVVHTGPNTELGGLKEGLLRVSYHAGMAFAVNIPAIAPIPRGRISDTISFRMFDFFMAGGSMDYEFFLLTWFKFRAFSLRYFVFLIEI